MHKPVLGRGNRTPVQVLALHRPFHPTVRNSLTFSAILKPSLLSRPSASLVTPFPKTINALYRQHVLERGNRTPVTAKPLQSNAAYTRPFATVKPSLLSRTNTSLISLFPNTWIYPGYPGTRARAPRETDGLVRTNQPMARLWKTQYEC